MPDSINQLCACGAPLSDTERDWISGYCMGSNAFALIIVV